MPPTLTTKSSDTLNAPRFSIVTKALAGEADPEGKPRFKAIASSTIVDRDGDQISLKALQQMAAKFQSGVTIFTDHENKVANAYGTTDTAEIIQGDNDAKGNAVWDLHISGQVNEPSPNAMQLHQSISGGYVKLGCSIDAFVLDHTRTKSGALSIDGLDVFAASIVGVPANQRSWTQKAVRAIKSFRPDEEDEPMPPENEGLEVPLGAVAELTVYPDGSSESSIIAEAGSPEAEAFGNASPADLAPAEVTVGEDGPEVVAQLAACPDCGQSADTTGCDNGFHAVAQATDEDTTGGQASADEAETPETAPSDESEADPAPEQKAAALSPEVTELLGHVTALVKEIGVLRDANAALTSENASLKTQNQTVFGEVELAKQVIGKVLEQPLRSKTAEYVTGFTSVHKLFDPDIAEYLAKRGE